MKKIFIITLISICTLILASCSEKAVNIEINFDSNGGTAVESIVTGASSTISMPENPTKEGYVFDGWYWDEDTYANPFTANSLLDAPLSSDMTVHAKWVEVTDDLSSLLLSIYDLAIEEGAFDGTYEEWLETVEGPKGQDGRKIVLQVDNNILQWRYIDEEEWNNLLDFENLEIYGGNSTYSIFMEECPNYTGNESEWIRDLVNGDLGKVCNSENDISAPLFEGVEDVVIYIYDNFDPLEGVIAIDNVDGNVTDKIEVFGNVDFNNFGVYQITYTVQDFAGNVREEVRQVTVTFDSSYFDGVEITLWHAFGDANQELLQEMFDSFNEMYPNVTINQATQGGYGELRSATINAITAGTTPTLVMGYSEHFVEYLNGNALVPLDEYIEHKEFGVDLDDFVPGFLEENQQYLDGNTYSMPFAKSTEVVIYNKTVFDYHGITIPNDRPLTWTDLKEYEDTIIGSGYMQCEFLFNADSAANFFINSSRQWDAGYTTTEGDLLIDNATTREMLDYYKDLMDQNILTFPIEWDQDYGSTNFLRGDVCMTQGSTAGVRYNLPIEGQQGKFGQFEIGITPIIQLEGGTASAIQQGPNIAMVSDATEAERLAAWLLIKHMTNTENAAFFAMNTGYVPVRLSAFNDPDYQAFLNTDDFDLLPFSMAANVAYTQVDYYQYEPAFVGRITSSTVRQEAGFMFERIYSNIQTVEGSLQQMLDQLGQ